MWTLNWDSWSEYVKRWTWLILPCLITVNPFLPSCHPPPLLNSKSADVGRRYFFCLQNSFKSPHGRGGGGTYQTNRPKPIATDAVNPTEFWGHHYILQNIQESVILHTVNPRSLIHFLYDNLIYKNWPDFLEIQWKHLTNIIDFISVALALCRFVWQRKENLK